MRLAYFSPMPPSKSGIADYSEALLEHLRELAEVRVFEGAAPAFDPAAFDLTLYQIGNNPFHAAAYETALRHPGVAVLHEFNLHHLIAELTIKKGDWDGYLREVAYDGGPEALEHARRVRELKAGPDYEGVPMMRRILEASRAVIVHSRFMETRVREAGFAGPVATIPHGAWIEDADGMSYRQRLGIDETTPLIGVFGFLKPYKRIAESLRAVRRLVRLEPRVKLLLVGESHPDFPLDDLIRTLGLSASVRKTGFVPAQDFSGYLAACDVVLNLRFPTVGETSGTLLRGFGMGKAVLVSEVGSFAEIPDEICLKVPVDASEEDLIFEYLNLLISREDVRHEIGRRAREWVREQCSWKKVAGEYASFLEAVVAGRDWKAGTEQETAAPVDATSVREPEPLPEPVDEETILNWSGETEGTREYANIHLTRLRKTVEITPPGKAGDRILEMGAYLQITPLLKTKLGYGEVRGCYYGPAGKVDHRSVVSDSGEEFTCDLDLFDAEKDPFPYEDEYFQTVVCAELIEHLKADPMHMMSEINRILAPGGHLVLTTPNIASIRAIAAILQGYHPGFFPAYLRPAEAGGSDDARHSREYTPKEIARLLIESGFEVTHLETGPFRDEPKPEHAWIEHLLSRYRLEKDLRGDGIYVVGRKTGPIRERYPEWLYN